MRRTRRHRLFPLMGAPVAAALGIAACGKTESDSPRDDLGGEGGQGGESSTYSGGADSGGTSPVGGSSAGGVLQAGGMPGVGGAEEGSGGSYVGPDGRCVPGSYATTEPLEPLVCAPWSECGPGEEVTRIGTDAEDRLCKPCEEGTFSSMPNAISCAPIKACKFGEKIIKQGTKTSDAVCETTGMFTPVPVNSSDEIIGATATPEGVYVLVGEPALYGDARVLRYSLTGKPLSTIAVSFGDNTGIAMGIESIGSDLYIAGQVRAGGAEYSTNTYVRHLDKNGKLLGETLFENRAYAVRMATDGVNLFLASSGEFPGQQYCYETEDPESPEYCFQTFYDALSLRRLNQEGTVLGEKILRGASGAISSLTGFTVTPTGESFVMASGGGFVPNEYDFVGEFDADFSLVHAHPVSTLGCSPCSSLVGGDNGQAYVLGRHKDLSIADHSITRLKRGGVLDVVLPVDAHGGSLSAMAATAEMLYLGGETFLGRETIFLRLEPDGTVIEDLIHEARIRQSISAIARAPNGQVYAAGLGYDSGREVFVTPWLTED